MSTFFQLWPKFTLWGMYKTYKVGKRDYYFLILLFFLRWHSAWHLKDQYYFGTFWNLDLFVLNLFGVAFHLSSKQKVSNCRHLKIDNIDPLSNFFHYFDSYFTLLSSLRWHSALSSEGQIIIGYIWKLSPQLICSQSIWSSIPP